MDGDSRRRILIVGSFRGAADQGSEEQFAQVCHELGALIARREHRLVFGSTATDTADFHVLAGYRETGGNSALYVRPDNARDDAPEDVEVAEVRRSVWRLRQLHHADGLVFVGGWSGTRKVHRLCRVLARPHVALPELGGQGERIFDTLREDAELWAPDRLDELDAARRNPEESLAVLDRLMKEPMLPPIERGSLEPHVLDALRRARGAQGVDADGVLRAVLTGAPMGGAFGTIRKIVAGLDVGVPEPPSLEEHPASRLLAPFGQSLRIAMTVGSRGVWGRTLVTAALFDPQIERASWIGEAIQEAREHWFSFLEQDDATLIDAWQEVFFQLNERRKREQPAPADLHDEPIDLGDALERSTEALAGYASDEVPAEVRPEDDRLDISDDVNALAAVIAAREVKPPLAIALFGDWGVGKSFFMKQMQSRIVALAAQSKAALASSGDAPPPAFLPDVAQIDFNAWHFMDRNLWASFVTRVFNGLADHIRKAGAKDPEAELFGELALLDETATRLRSDLSELEQRISGITGEVQELEQQREAARQQLDDLALPAIAGRVLVKALEENPDVRRILEESGVVEAQADARTLVDGLQELGDSSRGLLGRLRVRLTQAGSRDKLAWIAVGFLAVLVLSPLLGQWLVDWHALAKGVASALTWAVGVGTPVASAWRKGAKALGLVLSVVEEAEEESLAQKALRSQEEQDLAGELARLEGELAQRQASIAENQRQQEDARRKLRDLRSGRRLLEFVEERVSDAAYKNELGIVSVIREDFERLSRELAAQRKPRGDDTEKTSSLRKVDRIVLYIDDLDRCTPERVVEVMQAVHLLLAFPLFVVVVAVDSRWLLRSLAKVYPDFLTLDDPDTPATRITTPHNYLEKIFQVTFSLDPIQRDGYVKLVQSLTDSEDEEEGPTRDGTEKLLEDGQEGDGEPGSTGGDATRSSEGGGPEHEADRRAREPIDLHPGELTISDDEQRFIEALHEFFDTPRAVKRFVNTYRIIKVTHAGELADEQSQQIALLLLAALVGFPVQSPWLFEKLERSTVPRWSDFLTAFDSFSDVEKLDDLLQALRGIRAPWNLDATKIWIPRVLRYAPRVISPNLEDPYAVRESPAEEPVLPEALGLDERPSEI